jgi:hypothetical protein
MPGTNPNGTPCTGSLHYVSAFGTLAQRTVATPGTWRFDANLQKAVRLSESETLEFRVDASDVLNHPEPGTPNLNINATTAQFGQITGADAKSTLHRQFQAQMRLRC